MDIGPMAGRTVLITGGSGGIGRATALGLAAMGAHLAITGRDRERSEGAVREIRALGTGSRLRPILRVCPNPPLRRVASV